MTFHLMFVHNTLRSGWVVELPPFGNFLTDKSQLPIVLEYETKRVLGYQARRVACDINLFLKSF